MRLVENWKTKVLWSYLICLPCRRELASLPRHSVGPFWILTRPPRAATFNRFCFSNLTFPLYFLPFTPLLNSISSPNIPLYILGTFHLLTLEFSSSRCSLCLTGVLSLLHFFRSQSFSFLLFLILGYEERWVQSHCCVWSQGRDEGFWDSIRNCKIILCPKGH